MVSVQTIESSQPAPLQSNGAAGAQGDPLQEIKQLVTALLQALGQLDGTLGGGGQTEPPMAFNEVVTNDPGILEQQATERQQASREAVNAAWPAGN